MSSLLKVMLLASIHLLSNISKGQQNQIFPKSPLEKIDSLIQVAIEKQAMPGCQLYAWHDGEVLMNKSYGFHTYDSLQAVENSHLYDLASITKVTAATLALMKMHDQEKLSLDVPLSTYFPMLKCSNKKDLSLREALAHNAGLQSWIPFHQEWRKGDDQYKNGTIRSDSGKTYPVRISEKYFIHQNIQQRIFKEIKKSKVKKEQGYVYSGLLFYLIPDLIQRTYNQAFDQFLTSHFYQPLNAINVVFQPDRQYSLNEIVPTEIDTFFRQEKIHGKVHDEGAILMNGISGNAGLFANAGDLAKIWLMFMHYGAFDGKQYLKPQTVMKFTQCQYCERGNRRGLGFDKPLIVYDSLKSSVAEQASLASFGHTGYTGSIVWADPKNDLLFIFLSNRTYPSRDNKLIYEMNLRPHIHRLLYEHISQ